MKESPSRTRNYCLEAQRTDTKSTKSRTKISQDETCHTSRGGVQDLQDPFWEKLIKEADPTVV